MDRIEYQRVSFFMLDLIAGVFGAKDISGLRPDQIDLEQLYTIAEKNGLCAIVAYALKKADIHHDKFRIAYAKSQQRNLLLDREFQRLRREFNQANIRYLPLKGILLKSIYPSPCMREMTDIDILFFGSPEKVRTVMSNAGYSCIQYGKSNHDVYQKPPFFSVEMHRSLVDGSLFPALCQYFDELTYPFADDDSLCLQMTKEQMYLHLIAHAYVHDTLAGTGLRTLLDINLYLSAYEDQMDMSYIRKELAKIDLDDYEAMLRNLSKKLLTADSMSPEEKEQLDNYIFAGKYGNRSRYIQNRMKRIMSGVDKPSKLKYIRKRLSYNQKNIDNSPFFSKHPRLAPLMYITRPIDAVITRPKMIIKEIKQMKNK